LHKGFNVRQTSYREAFCDAWIALKYFFGQKAPDTTGRAHDAPSDHLINWTARRWSYAIVFTALHAMRFVGLSVRPSVCLSVCHTRDLWQNERKLCPNCYTTWKAIYHSL